MPSTIVTKILKRTGHDDLWRTLTEDLRGTELNSILLELMDVSASKLTPPMLLNQYQRNRFVKPSDLPVIELKRMELDLFEIFNRFLFEPIDLSPVSAFGSCSVVATADQKKILSALRGTEVLADATNAIALHVCDIKQRHKMNPDRETRMRFSAIQRHLRTQQISGKGFTPHFKIACLVTAGVDTGGFGFEKESLCEHLSTMKELYLNYFKADRLSLRFQCRKGGYSDSITLANAVREFVLKKHRDLSIDIIEHPDKEIDYYKGIQYKIDIEVKGKSYEIGDGGFVDWTQQLLQNRKERMLSTGIGFDFMYRILQGQL
jgi:hypothetical protein